MENQIRVLHVLHGMNCAGAENMIMNIYRAIDREKVQFDFLVHTTEKCFFDDEIVSLGGRIYRAPYFKVINEVQYKSTLRSFFENHKEIKIVHGHLGSCAHIYLKIAKEYGCYTIAHSHATNPTNITIKGLLYRYYTLKTRKIADYYMACSKMAGLDRYGSNIVASRYFKVLNNAIDSKKYTFDLKSRDMIRSQFGIQGKFVVGHTGRFTYAKNHEFLIKVFAKIKEIRTNAVLLLVGDGELRSEVECWIKEYHVEDSVIIAGVRNDVEKLLCAMDVFLFPSRWEGLGLAVIEAQASDLRVICSSSIPKEVAITDLVKYMSLNESVETWASQVLTVAHQERIDRSECIVNAGYDIHNTTDWLQQFYCGVIG